MHDTTQCQICQKPLGQESRDQGFSVCHAHRVCVMCDKTLLAPEVALCLKRASESSDGAPYEPIHPRCQVRLSRPTDPTLSIKQSDFDFLNLLRLMVVPNPNLSDITNCQNAMIQSDRLREFLISQMDWDGVYSHLKMLEACVAAVSIAIKQDHSQLKKRSEAREAEKAKVAAREARTSSRPTSTPTTDPGELQLATFMELHAIAERKTALKLMRDKNKAVAAWIKAGVPEKMALEMVTKNLIEQGRLSK